MYSIGDNIKGRISRITNDENSLSFDIDIGNNEWKCELQWNTALQSTVKLFKQGDEIDGWIIRKNEQKKCIAIGISSFGFFPPKPDVLLRYFESLLYFKKILLRYSESRSDEIKREFLSEMKGLVNRCIRKDQWDWFVIYRAFGFEDDSEVLPIASSFEHMSKAFKLFNHSKISDVEFKNASIIFLRELKECKFLSRIEAAIAYLNDESKTWEIMKVPVPQKPEFLDESGVELETVNESQIIKIGSHIRRGVSMSDPQKQRIIEMLNKGKIELTDGTILTHMNFSKFDWSVQTIVSDYEKYLIIDDSGDTFKPISVAACIETNIKRERANIVHSQLVNVMAQKILDKGLTPMSNGLIDLFACKNNAYLLFEMKSVHSSNECSQIRKAISQLYEYRFLHNFPGAELCMVLSAKPSENWILDYILNDRNILICWLFFASAFSQKLQVVFP